MEKLIVTLEVCRAEKTAAECRSRGGKYKTTSIFNRLRTKWPLFLPTFEFWNLNNSTSNCDVTCLTFKTLKKQDDILNLLWLILNPHFLHFSASISSLNVDNLLSLQQCYFLCRSVVKWQRVALSLVGCLNPWLSFIKVCKNGIRCLPVWHLYSALNHSMIPAVPWGNGSNPVDKVHLESLNHHSQTAAHWGQCLKLDSLLFFYYLHFIGL